jgi:hypothetical protein
MLKLVTIFAAVTVLSACGDEQPVLIQTAKRIKRENNSPEVLKQVCRLVKPSVSVYIFAGGRRIPPGLLLL